MTGLPRGMNPNLILNKVKRKLGVSTFKLPFNDDELIQILFEDTLPTFSKYFPRYVTLPIDLNNCRTAKYRVADKAKYYGRLAYHMKDELDKFGSEIIILDIEDVDFYNNDQSDFISYEEQLRGQSPYDIVTNSFGRSTVAAMLNVEPIVFFESPDVIILDEKGLAQIHGDLIFVTFLIMHSGDLSTINISYIDYLTKIYKLDLQIALYATLKHMDKIDTTFGEIDLKIDDWQDAESRRDELTEDWNLKFLKHRRKTIRKI